MQIVNSFMKKALKRRAKRLKHYTRFPLKLQEDLLAYLVKQAKNTDWGKKYDYHSIKHSDDFKSRVPVSSYESLYPEIERVMQGEKDVLWPGHTKWFAQSSGTTNDRSKFIPVTMEALRSSHYAGGKDLLSLYVNQCPDTTLFTGKSLSIGGSHRINSLNKHSCYGDISAVIMRNLPWWAQWQRSPSLSTALMEDWEAKIERMAEEVMNENITSIAGVPTWTVVLLQRILEKTGRQYITEVWPDLELFIHGAVSFEPYRELFNRLIPSDKMHYLETYNASEGFFGLQDQTGAKDLLLMLDYGIYYEFIPLDALEEDFPPSYRLDEIELEKSYAIVISSNAGLWRYLIGDTIKFTSRYPFRFRITGRTRHFINAFGEELMIENAESAVAEACRRTGAAVSEFTAAPVYFESSAGKGGHEWLMEFEVPPGDLEEFKETLDESLKAFNSDYEAKRSYGIALAAPLIRVLPQGTFYQWMKQKGKLGGQNKVPRLYNSRKYVDEILELVRGVE